MSNYKYSLAHNYNITDVITYEKCNNNKTKNIFKRLFIMVLFHGTSVSTFNSLQSFEFIVVSIFVPYTS